MTQSAIILAMPLLPLLGAALLALFGRRLGGAASGTIATLLAGLSFACALGLWAGFSVDSEAAARIGPWIATRGLEASLTLRLDSMALSMSLLVSGFGFLITLYSIGYMAHDEEPSRFFASLNLFVASMLILVLAENLLLIFLGWEGVGLCSYLLIGHYWREKGVPLAAYRAFFVNRIGDVLFLVGVFMLFRAFGTFDLQGISDAAASGELSSSARWGALLLLGGAFAKSAQVPLHVWLPDAMAGPTPVSALIHAATMVTAGVYLLARLAPLYLVPNLQAVLLFCAMATLIVGALLALSQRDIKKILAYSTVSNLGLMFLAHAAGAPGAAMMHLFGHAFFKALLFLAAGSVILSAHHEQDASRLAGVLRKLPVTRVAFWVGCIGGAGLLPYLAAGFFSKELVLESLAHARFEIAGLVLPGGVIFGIVLAVEFLTALYLFRLLGFLESDVPGEALRQDPVHAHAGKGAGGIRENSWTIRLVLGILILAAPLFGVFSATHHFGGTGEALYRWVSGSGEIPPGPTAGHAAPILIITLLLAASAYLAYSKGAKRAALEKRLRKLPQGPSGPLANLFYFDLLYEAILLKPLRVMGALANGVAEWIFSGLPWLAGVASENLSTVVSRLQSGKVHHYAAAILIAAFFLLLLMPGGS